jgi:hypothetical protein
MTLKEYTQLQIPRLLTQMDRDPDSPTFGCFDRNYWHYKVRDFPSAILQQSCVSLLYLPRLTNVPEDIARQWLEGNLRFWANLRHKQGGLDEYYPFEQSYPATAFSLQAVSYCLLQDGNLTKIKGLTEQIQATSSFLLKTFEDQALNQQAAGLSALAQVSKLGYSIEKTKLTQIANRFFSLQSDEGWFSEYGGPDLGYLSVTIDMLWDYYLTTKEKRALESIKKAISFIELFEINGKLITIGNSRETDYLVPYGIRHYQSTQQRPTPSTNIFKQIDSSHFLMSLDDRYLSHYVGNSCIKAVANTSSDPKRIKSVLKSRYLKSSGIVTRANKNTLTVIAGYKGGSYQTITKNKTTANYGVRVYQGKKNWVSNIWQSPKLLTTDKKTLIIKVALTSAHWLKPSPIKHLILRLLSYSLGNKLIKKLKAKLIFLDSDSTFLFERKFDLLTSTVVDKVTTESDKEFYVSSGIKQPIRHVASAYQYSPLDIVNAGRPKQSVEHSFKHKHHL